MKNQSAFFQHYFLSPSLSIKARYLAISFFFKGKITPIFTAVAYTVGFIAGAIFQTDGVDVGGGTTNNLWIIWVIVFVCLTLAGVICEKFIGSVKKATK